MRILALSDTHGDVSALVAVLKWARNFPPDAAFFLGDGLNDLHRAVSATGFSCVWHTVRGNNDFVFSVPEAAVADCGAHRFFLCHGHRYSLYRGFDTLIAVARNNGADAALFGHTHVPQFENVNGITLINPGSIGRPRSEAGATFAVIECLPDMPLQAEFHEINPQGNIRPMAAR